jgi:8-amino-7-oxononanoate synthase
MTSQGSKNWQTAFSEDLQAIAANSQLRKRAGLDRSRTSRALLDFGSNDYLGLRNRSEVATAVAKAMAEHGWGSGGSPVLNGYSDWHSQLEEAIAKLCDCEAAVVFSSGYACNVGSLACLTDASDAIYSDALNHASLIDGIRLSQASRFIFRHNDMLDLENQLREHRHEFKRVLVVTESVFSMDGDCTDLLTLERLARQYDCGLVVDEAHATGIYGQAGGGVLSELGLSRSPNLILKLGTLSKAIGGIGGFAAGSTDAMSFLINRCRSYMFSTAPPAAAMAAALVAIDMFVGMEAERRQLREHSKYLRTALRSAGWTVYDGDSPVIPVIVGSESDALEMHNRLLADGIYVPAIRPPTVPDGSSRLRISLSAGMGRIQMDALIRAIGPANAVR